MPPTPAPCAMDVGGLIDGRKMTLPKISKAKARNLKALVTRRMQEKREARKLVAPDPPPRYDEVFEEGQQWLASLTES